MARPKKETLAWLASIAGELNSETLRKLEETLAWYREMPAARRASVGVVAQSGISSFLAWYDNPKSQPWVAADVFGVAPRELLRSISLQQTLQLIRVVVQVVEERVVREDPEMREAVLLYSREIAFSAADVYAKAAEARGLWDARLEALVVDSILSGEHTDEIASRVAALGWRANGSVVVLIGNTQELLDADQLRRLARKADTDVLIGVHGDRLIVVVGIVTNSDSPRANLGFSQIVASLESSFGQGPVVIGPTVRDVSSANVSARAALSAFAVVRNSKTERVLHADDVLAERALAGDALAKQTLVDKIYKPLASNSIELLETLVAYLECGRSLEATAKKLFVHANTVRYRLKRISDVIGWDPTGAHEAFVLQVAMVLGAMQSNETEISK
ncbi:MAG: helix-turn-helix domain-containing protein [Rhodoluna sp.]|nr:helix-turn-helix domain-containing protein [Rhodoluna sp.]